MSRPLREVKSAHFNHVWGEVGRIIDEVMAKNPAGLAQALRQVELRWRRMTREDAEGTCRGRRIALPRAALIGARQALQMTSLLAECRCDTGMIVELGSGWGLNILDLYAWGGPAKAHYAALELTEAGCGCSQALASLAPELDFKPYAFDYTAPDYSALPRGHAHVLAFSSHSVEQIPQLSAEVVEALLALGRRVTGVHFEPVGWQMGPHPADWLGASEANAVRHDYNRNFWRLLNKLAEEGKIVIRESVADLFGHKTKNASSLIIWEKL